jgi:uncharacterized membrane protein YgcG
MKSNHFRNTFLACILSSAVALGVSPVPFGVMAFAQDSPQNQAPPPPQDQAPPPPQDEAQAPPPDQAPAPDQPAPARLSQQQLQELVAPIALYPDALVAQILAASAYPTQVVEAERFVQGNPDLKGKDLADAVDQQPWDPSVKALTQFPSVLANMDKDLTWTSELGDANVNQQADVMNAIQYMRHQAEQAGNLKSTPQQTVSNQGDDIDIEPAQPDVVYVPEYDPELVYGYPVALWPGFYPWWGIGGPYISFGIGFGIGPFVGFGWGWGHWGFNWYNHGLVWGGHPYVFHSNAFYNRDAYFHGGFHGNPGFAPGDRGMRGFAGGRAAPAGHPGAFGGVDRGGDARSFSSRGRSSFGGGGFHGGGGGFHGGGGGGHR